MVRSIAFHSTKNSEISKQGQIAQKFPGKVSRKSWNCWVFETRTIQPKFPEIPGVKSNGTEIPDNNFPKISVNLVKLSSLPEILKNTVSFATGTFRKFKPESLLEWKAPDIFSVFMPSEKKNPNWKSQWIRFLFYLYNSVFNTNKIFLNPLMIIYRPILSTD